MHAPFAPMVLLYGAAALAMAANAALTSYGLTPAVSGLPWLRVHLVTIGILIQLVFAMLLHAGRAERSDAASVGAWPAWLALNVGLPLLLVGIPTVSPVLIASGGGLVLVAAVLVLRQTSQGPVSASRPFYLAGLAYLLFGVTVGTGLWLGWTAPFNMAAPKEVHIHANAWGFLSLTYAGLLLDMRSRFTGALAASSGRLRLVLALMVLGALGLVLGPWFDQRLMTGPGMLAYLAGTILLLATTIPSLLRSAAPKAGAWHLLLAYAWIITPLMAAPFILMGAPNFPAAVVEQNAPQALIYGWALQFGFAVGPYVLRRLLQPAAPAALGGSAVTLVLVNAGAVAIWVSIVAEPVRAVLHGTAYVLWAAALACLVCQVCGLVRGAGEPAGNAASPMPATPPAR